MLAAFVRNISDKSQHIDLRPEMVWNVPQVINSDGTVMKIEKRAMLGTIHPYRETLAPSEVFGPLYLNVGPGDNPRPPLQNWSPWIAAPTIGKYHLTHSIPLQVADSNAPRDGKDTVWTTGKLTSGNVNFEISEPIAGLVEKLRVAKGETDDLQSGQSYRISLLVLATDDLKPVAGAVVRVTFIGDDRGFTGDGGFAPFVTNDDGIAIVDKSLWPGRYQVNVRAPKDSRYRDTEFSKDESMLIVHEDARYSPREFRLNVDERKPSK